MAEGSIPEGPAPARLTVESFIPAVGEAFTVGQDGGARVELLLVEATPQDARPQGPPPFSLLFHGPAEPFLPQATYRFEHDSLGVLEIFIVPLGRDEHGSAYEAVFA